jgi:dienelactone hydrolase
VTLGFLLLFAGLIPAGAAPTARAESFPTGEIVPRVVCEVDLEQSYALYLPTSYTATRTWPLLYLYDPRKRGALAAERFREAAERYGWILVSSNNTMSDGPMAPNVAAINAMWADASRRFSVDPRRVYAAGFSGGARTACLLAQKMEGRVAGVIACGGGFADGSPPEKGMRFAVFGTVGNVDFNYGEMRRLDRTLAKLGARHRLAVFDGPHSWCPAPVCTEGVEWMELAAIKSGARPKDSALVERFLRERLERAAALEGAGKTVDAFLRYTEAVEDFAGVTDTKSADAARVRLGALAAVRKGLEEQERREEKEARSFEHLWKELTEALTADPPPPLQAIVNQLRVPQLVKEAGSERPEPERLSARRVLEQLSVQTSFYLARDFASKHDFLRAELVTGIAEALKPDRAGTLWYDLACFRAVAGDRRGALESLRTAVKKGFRQVDLIETDPDLASLREEKDYRAIVAELKR